MTTDNTENNNTAKSYLIWDLPLRLFHWLLVLTFAALWITVELGSEYMQYHMYCGYFMLFLLVFRILWGIVGTTHARFISFFPTLSRLKSYLKQSPETKPHRVAGHNPLGAFMVFLMLAVLLAQATSGLFITDDVIASGPYYGSLDGDLEKLANRIHHWGFTILQIAVTLHISAIVFYKIVKKQKLVKAMVTGKKPADEVEPEQAIKNSRLLVAIIIAAIAAAFVYWLVVVNAPAIEDYYYY